MDVLFHFTQNIQESTDSSFRSDQLGPKKKKKKDLVWPVSEALAYQEARTSLRCHVIKMITSSRLLRACDLVVFVISSLCLLCLRHVVFLGYFDEVAVLSRL